MALFQRPNSWYNTKMKTPTIPVERLKETVHYDPLLGSFTWKIHMSKGRFKGQNAIGYYNRDGYGVIYIDKKYVLAQKVAFAIVNGSYSDAMVSFKDKDRKNLKWENLCLKTKTVGKFDHSTNEGRVEYRKARYSQHKDKAKSAQLNAAFGIDLREYERMFVLQGGKCAIHDGEETAEMNGVPMSLSVDHDHETGAVRGLLCRACNVALGGFRENEEFLFKAIDYLRFHKKNQAIPDTNVIPLKGIK